MNKKDAEQEIRKILLSVSTPNLSDAMNKAKSMEGVYPIVKDKKIVGKAVTVKTVDGDPVKCIEAIGIAGNGDVIVIKCSGDTSAVWGELATASCINKGIVGVIVDGAVRDVDDIRDLGFPVFAKRVVPNVGDLKGRGEINVNIICGGLEVNPGDWIVADDNGVIVLQADRAYEIAKKALLIKKHEEKIRTEIKLKGRTLAERDVWLEYTNKSFLKAP